MNALEVIDSLRKKNPKTYRYSLTKIRNPLFKESVRLFTNFLPEEATHSQRLWHLSNGILEIPKCPICENENLFKDGSSGYTKFCSGSCEIKNKWKKTSTERKKEIYKKQKATNKERYGEECTFNSPEVKEKIQKSLKKYGENVTNPGQIPGMQERIKDTLLNRYGVVNPGLTENAMKAKIERYGSENPFSSCEIQEKIKKTNLEKYGSEFYLRSEEGKKKVKESVMEKYGVEHPMQNIEIFEKATKHRSYKYIASNGKEYTLQGYENFALEELLEEYEESDIVHGISAIQKFVKFQYFFEGKLRNYFPDFYIISKNLIVEVKSTFSYKYEEVKNCLKKQAVLDFGANFEFRVYDDRGKRIT